MESVSRPFHRRKLSNSYSGKNAYEGVFSGHHRRRKFDGAPAVSVSEYNEIFGSNGGGEGSIPVIDLTNLQESSDCVNLNLEVKPDYTQIFGGFRDNDIAVNYQDLIFRDKARAPSSTSHSSQDADYLPDQSSDDLKQFNLSYNKISQRSKGGLDGTTHVTQLHAVPGFTCFIDESASQPNKETENQKASVTNTAPERQTSQNGMESRSKHGEDNSLFGDERSKTFQTDIKSHPSVVTSSPAASSTNEAPSQPKKEFEKQKSSVTNIHLSGNSRKGDYREKQTSQRAVESRSKDFQENLLSDDINVKIFQAEPKSHVSKVSSPPALSATVDEAASQPKNGTEKQKSSLTNNVHPIVNSSKADLQEKQTSRITVESSNADCKSHASKVSSPFALSATNDEAASQSKNGTEKQKSSLTNNVHPIVNSSKADLQEKQTFRSTVESSNADCPDESLTDDRYLKTFQADLKSHPSKISSQSPVASATNSDKYFDYETRSTATTTGTFKDTPGEFPPVFFDEELDENSVAAVSAAALRKAIEKAQESIRIAKESVGRKKEGLRGFSSKSFKDSLKVKARVPIVNTCEEQKEKDDRMKAAQVFSNGRSHHKHVGTVLHSDFADGEKLFGTKNVINDIHGKILEAVKDSEIPLRPPHELRDNKIVCNSEEVVDETRSSEATESTTYEAPQKDNERANDFLVLGSCEKGPRESGHDFDYDEPDEPKENKHDFRPSITHKLAEELNNLTVYQKVEDETQDQNGYKKRFIEELGLLENKKQEVLEQESDESLASEESNYEASEKVLEDERELKDTESQKVEDTGKKFYDIREVETVENAPNYAYSLGTSEMSSKEEENHKAEEASEKVDKIEEPQNYASSSSDYDDAEESESVSVHSQKACRDDQNDNNPDSSQEIDDVNSCSTQEFLVEDTEAVEKVIYESIFVDQRSSEGSDDECVDASNSGLADVDFGQNDVRSESSSDTMHGMEIEVKEYKETEEKVVSVKEGDNNHQQLHEERPEIRIKETGTSQEPKDEIRDSGPSKIVEKEQTKRIKEVTAEERERERVKLAVDRAIREARERAFVEARERAERAAAQRVPVEIRQKVMADSQDKVAKASDKASTQSKLRAERAAVERATAEARQRALEKAMSQKKISEPKVVVNEIKQTSSSVTHTSTESALRSKAKLEKHNRIMERAAQALAEKEKRDLLVLREQAERNRLAENLDADIKRWSNGKEGNLRALLSTLQYILGAESGWQPVSLTEIITTSAVKKAYRKATLCVHPDKLQQRGASIQQKYICEKVFDLLKAAWNKFNSEER
uniref:auxilin-like protein 1 n=1 Tax=Erigeron canadensis TaxID=72917 RepID=UPI001CB92B6E|nr:auxilin-like protein 1 [Erigeron canadensis]